MRRGAPWLIQLPADDSLQVAAARLGRFYGDGLRWSLSLTLTELADWARIMPKV